FELRLSEDAAFRRGRAARLCREFPVILEHIAAGEIHLTALLLLGPHLTDANHRELLARAKYRTKREVLRLVRRIAPEPDVPASVEPLGPPPVGIPIPRTPTWEQFMEALSGPVRELEPGDRPKEWITRQAPEDDSDLAVPQPSAAAREPAPLPPVPERYRCNSPPARNTSTCCSRPKTFRRTRYRTARSNSCIFRRCACLSRS